MHSHDPLAEHIRIDTAHTKALEKLRITTVEDLLYHLPTRYENIAEIQSVSSLKKGDEAIVYGKVGGLKTRKAFRTRKPIAEGWIEDSSGRIKVIWFHQPYIAKMLPEGGYIKLAGKVTGESGKLYLANPEFEQTTDLPIDRHDSLFTVAENGEEVLYPIYKETKGITSKWIYHQVQKLFALGALDMFTDPLPEDIRKRYNLPELATALQWIHTPKKATHTASARKRFAFEEVFYVQITKQQERARAESEEGYIVNTDADHIKEFTDRFEFALTNGQQGAIADILSDFKTTTPMSRLLEGDVGSGKTAVAATTAYAVATSRPETNKDFGNLQVAYMAPTEILARQHFESFIEYFHHLPIQIGLITGSGCMKFPSKVDPTKPTDISRAQLLKWVANGEIPILIGTHTLIQKAVTFEHLAYVIIDEQHRFGTNQRRLLAQKDSEGGKRFPHLLSMTATPIPRTLALTVYGDLDITLLTEMPKGRKPIKTSIVTPPKRKEMYASVRNELEAGRQVYVICPRINEPDPSKLSALQARSVKEEAEHLKKDIFPEYAIDILHSKLQPKAKEAVMGRFAAGEVDILVATSVIEVGVNVPNATVIVIEGAERFGLAQLHQLRGRVIRSNHQAHCFAVTESKSKKSIERLTALETAKNGFELSEKDLVLRGAGELYGGKQWGLSDLGMEAIQNLKMVEAARKEAITLIKKDPDLQKHPAIAARIKDLSVELHWE